MEQRYEKELARALELSLAEYKAAHRVDDASMRALEVSGRSMTRQGGAAPSHQITAIYVDGAFRSRPVEVTSIAGLLLCHDGGRLLALEYRLGATVTLQDERGMKLCVRRQLRPYARLFLEFSGANEAVVQVAYNTLTQILQDPQKLIAFGLIGVDRYQYEQYQALWDEVARRLNARYAWWSMDQCVAITEELYRCLVCKACVEDMYALGLPPKIDEAWHEAILNTKLYQDFCVNALGRFIHHTTTTSQDGLKAKNERITATRLVYKIVWEEDPPADLWEREHAPEPSDSNGQSRRAVAMYEEPANAPFRVHVNFSWTSATLRTLVFMVSNDLTLGQLKSYIQDDQGIPIDQQRLTVKGVPIPPDDTRTLGSFDGLIHPEVTISVHLRLRGC